MNNGKNGAVRHGDAIPCIAMSDYEDGVNLSINPPLIKLSTSSTLYILFCTFLNILQGVFLLVRPKNDQGLDP